MATFSPCPFRITQFNLLHSSSSPSIGIRPTSQIPSSRCIVCSHRSPGVVLCDDDKYGKKEVISLTPKLYQYVLSNVREPDILRAVREETATMRGSQMQVSPEQAQFLSMLVQMLGANRCIELGVYTGYSSLAIALALPESGVIIACEKDGRFLEIAKKHWKQAGVCDKVIIKHGPAMDTLKSMILNGESCSYDFAFVDADKRNSNEYFELLLQLIRVGGVIVIDNVLWHGRVVDPQVNDLKTQAIRDFNSKIYNDHRIAISMMADTHKNTAKTHHLGLHKKAKYFEAKDTSSYRIRNQSIAEQRRSLPITSVEKRIVEEIKNNKILIIVGETGSGKTTQLPQFLFNAGFCHNGKVIGITQPRRVAAVTVAKRVSEECSTQLGQKVGYSIRFDDKTSKSTRIKYMTDGLLLREALLDPFLSRYSIIIVDEAHERTVHTDVLLGLLKRVQKSRSTGGHFMNDEIQFKTSQCQKSHGGLNLPPLKLVIMSASLNAGVFSEYFDGAKAVHIQGRQHPVDILYTFQPEPDYLDAAMITIFQVHLDEEPGDILVFLTGQEEIESVERLVKERVCQLAEDKQKVLIVPMYSSLPSEQQMAAFKKAPPGFRKIILATNIAETSVTISGIKYVIDPGLVKARSYNHLTGMESLITVPVSKAQAIQRSGRAGREAPGMCFRLYPENEFSKLADSTVPEIKRSNLSNVVLQLKALGIDDIIGFDFMEKPSRMSILKSLEQLLLLGALTDEYKLSDPIGKQMSQLPLDPIYSKALILAGEFKCLEEMLIIVAMLSVESIFFFPREKLEEARAARKNFSSVDGDHITLVNVFRSSLEFLDKLKLTINNEKSISKNLLKWCKENFINNRSLRHARDVHSQIQRYVQQMGLSITSCGLDMLQFRRCLTAAFFLNAALKRTDGSYRAISGGQTVQIHPSSVLFHTKPECIIFNELVKTNHNYIRNLTRIDPLWLPELAPQYYATQN